MAPQGIGAFIAIPFVTAVMGMSGTLLYDTLRGIGIRNKAIPYYLVTLMTAFSVGLTIMLVLVTVTSEFFPMR